MLMSSSYDEIERQAPSTTSSPLADLHHSQIISRLQQYMDKVPIMRGGQLKSIEKLKRLASKDDVAPALNEMRRLTEPPISDILESSSSALFPTSLPLASNYIFRIQ
ncbi:hypothetical protein EC988_005175 [Linderina pennispora]|nr:hypothetical protein EC988_005175 [Linderina pennispora]